MCGGVAGAKESEVGRHGKNQAGAGLLSLVDGTCVCWAGS